MRGMRAWLGIAGLGPAGYASAAACRCPCPVPRLVVYCRADPDPTRLCLACSAPDRLTHYIRSVPIGNAPPAVAGLRGSWSILMRIHLALTGLVVTVVACGPLFVR